MKEITIHKSSEKELKAVQLIGKQTFFETFAESNTDEDMRKYLDENFSDEKIRIELNNPESFFFIAWNNEEPVGYLKLNIGKAQTELQYNKSLEIERIYVLKEFHGKKVGQILYEKAMQVAIQMDVDYIWLGVWEKNLKAIRFYQKNGFIEFDQHIFKLGDDEQTDIMMKKQLNSIER